MLPKLIIVVIILGLGFFGIGQIKQETNNDEKEEKIFYEKIPGSKFHSLMQLGGDSQI